MLNFASVLHGVQHFQLQNLQVRFVTLYTGTGAKIRCFCSVHKPIAVAAPSKAWICDRSLSGIAGSNPSGVMDVSLL